MNNNIIIKNFSILKDIEFNLNKINIVIGDQSQGKSTLAKLIYFFNTIIFLEARNAVMEELKETEYLKRLENIFNSIFPENFWNDKPFEITSFSSKSEKPLKIYTKNNKLKLQIPAKIYENFKIMNDERKNNTAPPLKSMIKTLWEKFESIGTNVFIPAGRSYFSTLQSNIFSLLYLSHERKNNTIDYMLKSFGLVYEQARQKYSYTISEKTNSAIKAEIQNILKGEYIYKDKSDKLLMTNNKIIDLINSSSGQQEVLPIIVTLIGILKDPLYAFRNRLFIIEEPEAHLFPSNQKKIIELFSLVHNLTNKKTKFFITTHSPYILSSFNNLIQAQNSYNAIINNKTYKPAVAKKKIAEIISYKKWLNFDDVSSYYLKDGYLKDINNYENKLIDENAIDGISDEIANEFGNLLNYEYGE